MVLGCLLRRQNFRDDFDAGQFSQPERVKRINKRINDYFSNYPKSEFPDEIEAYRINKCKRKGLTPEEIQFYLKAQKIRDGVEYWRNVS